MDADAGLWLENEMRASNDQFFLAARQFYGDALGGHELHSSAAEGNHCLWFMIQHQCIAVRPRPGLPASLTLEVDNPQDVAARCWDAGYTIVFGDCIDGECVLVVIDPFGLRIELMRAAHTIAPSVFRTADVALPAVSEEP